jgi:hypothetical protein
LTGSHSDRIETMMISRPASANPIPAAAAARISYYYYFAAWAETD